MNERLGEYTGVAGGDGRGLWTPLTHTVTSDHKGRYRLWYDDVSLPGGEVK